MSRTIEDVMTEARQRYADDFIVVIFGSDGKPLHGGEDWMKLQSAINLNLGGWCKGIAIPDVDPAEFNAKGRGDILQQDRKNFWKRMAALRKEFPNPLLDYINGWTEPRQ